MSEQPCVICGIRKEIHAEVPGDHDWTDTRKRQPLPRTQYRHQHEPVFGHPVIRTRKVDDMIRVCRDCGENVVPLESALDAYSLKPMLSLKVTQPRKKETK